MARAGQQLTNPYTGQRLVFRRTTAETDGELVEVEAIYGSAGDAAPEHYHPSQDERFEVLEGEIVAVLSGVERRLRPGDVLEVPAGTPHLFRKDEGTAARLVWQTRPALETEAFFETIWGLAEDGKVNRKGTPNPLRIALIAREFDDEFRLTSPPRAVQRILFGALAALGRLLGYRGRYERA